MEAESPVAKAMSAGKARKTPLRVVLGLASLVLAAGAWPTAASAARAATLYPVYVDGSMPAGAESSLRGGWLRMRRSFFAAQSTVAGHLAALGGELVYHGRAYLPLRQVLVNDRVPPPAAAPEGGPGLWRVQGQAGWPAAARGLRWQGAPVQPSRSGTGVPHLDREVPVVALTFDDGPDPRFTPAILDILRQEHVPATFFVVGRNALLYPDLVRQELADGHVVGNHTFDHLTLADAGPELIRSEIRMGQEAIQEAGGGTPTLFRPPDGLISAALPAVARELGYRVVLWSAAVENHTAPTPVLMVRRVLRLVRPGSIILLHDGRLDRTRTVEALPLLIEQLKARGYFFATVPVILGPQATPGNGR